MEYVPQWFQGQKTNIIHIWKQGRIREYWFHAFSSWSIEQDAITALVFQKSTWKKNYEGEQTKDRDLERRHHSDIPWVGRLQFTHTKVVQHKPKPNVAGTGSWRNFTVKFHGEISMKFHTENLWNFTPEVFTGSWSIPPPIWDWPLAVWPPKVPYMGGGVIWGGVHTSSHGHFSCPRSQKSQKFGLGLWS